MEILGNLELLKKEIEKSYEERMDEFRKQAIKEFNEEKKRIDDAHKETIKKAKAELQNEEKKILRTVSAEEKLNAKKEFENKREALINEVFLKAEERSPEILSGDKYLNLIQDFIKGKESIELAGSLEPYKKQFPGIKISKKLQGIIIKEKNKVYDHTYSTFIESRKLDLRHKISHTLFENAN